MGPYDDEPGIDEEAAVAALVERWEVVLGMLHGFDYTKGISGAPAERLSVLGEGLSSEELAFYDALAANETAVDVMGDEQLRIIAHEFLEQLRKNATIAWHRRESARAKMRVLTKRILKKFGYPPDLSKEAVKTVIEQAKLWSREVA